MLKFTIVILCIVFSTDAVFSQDSTKVKRVKVLPVPAFGYSPETKTYIGAVSLFTFHQPNDTLTRTSNAKVKFTYTWNKQAILETGWNYFFNHEKWFTKGQLSYSIYPDFYYGIGPNSSKQGEVTYTANRFIAEVFALKKVERHWFTGPVFRYINYSKLKVNDSSLTYRELTNGASTGFGYSLNFDSRNNILTPTSGFLFDANASYNLSSSDYLKLVLDFRFYKTWNEKITLATRLFNEINSGTPPFYDMAFLGGDKYVRGYALGRYRDNNMSTFQTECRFPIGWIIGGAAFGGVATLYSKQYPLNAANIQYNYGLGLRFRVDKKEKTNLRFDYALGKDGNNGFYIAFGESF